MLQLMAFLFLSSRYSCNKEALLVPDDFMASKGTYIGVVHIAYGEIAGYAFKGYPVDITSINRQTEGNNLQMTINWTNPNDERLQPYIID